MIEEIRELNKKCTYRFEVRYRDSFLKTIRKKYFNTLSEINEFKLYLEELQKTEESILSTNDCSSYKYKSNIDIKISEAVDLYLSTITNTKTKETMRYHYNTFLGCYGDTKIKDFSKYDIEKWKVIQLNRNVSDSTIYHRLSLLRSAFNFVLKKNIINTHCFKDIILVRPKHNRYKLLSINEIKNIYKLSPDHIKRIIVLGVFTGIRVGPSEMFRLKWSDVDFNKNIIYAPNADKGSTNEKRIIPIRDDIKDYLIEWFNSDNKVLDRCIITYNNKSIKSINTSWRKLIKKAGVSQCVRPYSLRHTFATLAIAYGGDLKCISEIMGHSDTKMLLKTYQHTTFSQKIQSINNIPNFLADTK